MNSSKKSIHFKRAAVVILQFALVTDLPGQSIDYGAFEELFEEPVTTSVTGSPQRSSEAPASIEIITREEIRRSGARDIPGVLQHVAGMNVFRWTNNGADVSVRGYNSSFTPRLLVMINGRQVYADHYGYVPWSTLSVTLEEIRQIEIVKGPNSALFGFNAVGGVINIITLNPRHDDINFVTLRAGTQNTFEGAGATTFNPGNRTGVRLSADIRSNDDFDTPQRLVDRGTRRGDEREMLRIDVHSELADNVVVEFEGSYAGVDQVNMAPNYQMGFEEAVVKSARGGIFADTQYGLLQAVAYRNWIDNEVFATGFDGVGYYLPETAIASFHNEVSVFQIQDIFKAGVNHTLRLAGEYRESSLNTTPFTGGQVSYVVRSISGMWNWQLSPVLSLTTAVRFDQLKLQRKGLFPAGFLLSNAYWDRRINEASYNTGLVWALNANNTLRLTAAKGALLPSLYNLGGSLFEIEIPPEFGPPFTLYISGVPTLEPTIIDNYELAWTRNFPAAGIELKAAFFVGETRDIIADTGDYDFEKSIFSSPANIGDSNLSGLELSVKGTMGENWRWGLGYIHERIEDDFGAEYPSEFTLKNYEMSTPENIVTANLGWARGPWEIDGFLRHETATVNFRSAEDFLNPQVLYPVPEYTVLDARIGYRVSDAVSMELSGENLLHDKQIQHSGPAVERTVYLKIFKVF